MATSGPPDHPGYQVITMTGQVDEDTETLNNWAAKGFRVAGTYGGNVILSWGYDQHGGNSET